MPKIQITDYIQLNCELIRPSIEIFIGIYHASNGNPCAGCAFRPDCGTRHDLESMAYEKKRGQKKHIGETNVELAKRLGVSKRQVAKMRKSGEL